MNSLYITLGAIGTPEIILIIAVVVLLFGGKKIPELMKGLGGGIKEFKKAAKGEDESPVAKKEEETKE
jgi:sec-independent protein translocase protein TatA